MRFCEHLSAHLTPEWRTQYVRYEELRDFITKAAEEAPSEDFDHGVSRHHYFNKCDSEFFDYCLPECNKVNNFFEEKLAEARRKFVALKSELLDYEESSERKTSMWHSLQMLAGGSGDRKKLDRKTKRKKDRDEKRKAGEKLSMEEDDASLSVDLKMNGQSVIQGLTQRLSSANLQHVIQKTQMRRQELRHEKRRVRKLHDIKLAFSEFYLSLVLLQNYQSLNFQGFRKILKKHDKLFLRKSGEEWRKENIDHSSFHSNKEVDQLITKVETLYTRELEQGDRSRAMKRLRVPPLAQKLNPWTTFRVGFLFGLFTIQVIVIILSAIFLRPLPFVWEPAVRLYRGSFIVSVFILLIGINTYGWQLAGVNHVLIFEIDPRNHLTHQEFLEISGLLLNAWTISLLYFLFSPTIGCPPYAGPFVLTILFLLYLLNPFRCLHYKARRWLLRIMYRIFTTPLYSVSFADFWLADQLNSLAIVFLDGLFFTCFYSTQMDWKNGFVPAVETNSTQSVSYVVNRHGGVCTGQMYGVVTVLRCLPAWFRFAQCIRRYFDMPERAPYPHLVNAGKYSTTFFVAVLGALYSTVFRDSNVCLAFLLTSLIIGTIYTYAWDILMDWGLFDFNEIKCNMRNVLRDELVYHKTISYYFAIVENLILRLSWVIDLTLSHYLNVNKDILVCFLALGEAFRRFVWNFFRLENEHLNNCGQFRAVRDIFISPITSTEGLKGTPKSQRSAASDSSGAAGTTASGKGKTTLSDNTPNRYQPKGNRLFSSRNSLAGGEHVHPHNVHYNGADQGLLEGSIDASYKVPKFELTLNV